MQPSGFSFVAIKAVLICTENQDIGLVIDALQVRKLGFRELEFSSAHSGRKNPGLSQGPPLCPDSSHCIMYLVCCVWRSDSGQV